MLRHTELAASGALAKGKRVLHLRLIGGVAMAAALAALLVLALTGASATHQSTPPLFALEWGSMGTGDGEFGLPEGVAVDSVGIVYGTDPQTNRIQKFASGDFLAAFDSVGSGGQARAEDLSSPRGIAVDGERNVWLVNSGKHQVLKFDPEGRTLLEQIGDPQGLPGNGSEEFDSPTGIAVDVDGKYLCRRLRQRSGREA